MKATVVLLASVFAVTLGQAKTDNASLAERDFAGTWVFQLGPKVLFAVHLETGSDQGQVLHGYFLRPEHFSIHGAGESARFSNITRVDHREAVVSSQVHDGELTLVETNPTSIADRDTFQMRRIDPTHVSFKVFPPLAPLRLEKVEAETPVLASDWDETRSYSEDDFDAENAEMKSILAADQGDRKDEFHIDWIQVLKADESRRRRTAVLVRDGKLHTGNDLEGAAFVFQHGSTPDDYLLAHALAMAAVAKGDNGAIWIASATLDRYLQATRQPQVFGTPYRTLAEQPTTQEPYNRSLIPDSLRRYLGVPVQAEQEKQREKYDVERGVSRQIMNGSR